MNLKKVQIITEARKEKFQPREKTGIVVNSTEDQFPYIEAAIDILDTNLKWWKKNFQEIESFFDNELKVELKKGFELPSDKRNIRVDFTIYNGIEETTSDVKYNGPAITYTFNDVPSDVVNVIRKKLVDTNLLEGKKTFIERNKIIIMFG